MTSNNPHPTAAILGNNTPAPLSSGILGGLDGIRQKLALPDLALRMEALDQAWSYGEAGKTCLAEMLTDRSKTVRRRARWLLRQPEGATLMPEAVWNLTERLDSRGNYGHAVRFANREVQELTLDQLQAESPIVLLPDRAYAIHNDYRHTEGVLARLTQLMNLPTVKQLEALVIGEWSEDVCTGDTPNAVIDQLVEGRDRLPNLKALFIGDIDQGESEISWIEQSDMSSILQAYPQLEVLQVRGGNGLRFSACETHENLRVLILETGGLSRETVHQVYNWQFPALEHLEFWFGDENYGGDCWDRDLVAILEDLKFPNLSYLGLRNAKFTNEIVDRVIQSPLLAGLQVLDVSMGTLGDEGAVKLLDCEAIKDLEVLNVAESYLSGAMIDQLNTLGIRVIADEQREEEDYGDDIGDRRYCAVSE